MNVVLLFIVHPSSFILRPVRFHPHLRVGWLYAAVAALARLEVDDGLEQVAAAEIGPEHFGDVNLGVRDLPQQEIRDAQLAAGADQKVGFSVFGSVEGGGEESSSMM